jgi:aspartate aminotransferase-like enzyme
VSHSRWTGFLLNGRLSRAGKPPSRRTTFRGKTGCPSCGRTRKAERLTLPRVGCNYRSPRLTTAPVQLVYALQAALNAIVEGKQSLEERFAAHKAASNKFKDAMASLGFDFVPLSREVAANGMSAVKFPKGLTAADIVPKLAEKDIVVAGGLHKAIATTYFRVGHMGITAVEEQRGDVDKIIKGIKEVLAEKGWQRD